MLSGTEFLCFCYLVTYLSVCYHYATFILCSGGAYMYWYCCHCSMVRCNHSLVTRLHISMLFILWNVPYNNDLNGASRVTVCAPVSVFYGKGNLDSALNWGISVVWLCVCGCGRDIIPVCCFSTFAFVMWRAHTLNSHCDGHHNTCRGHLDSRPLRGSRERGQSVRCRLGLHVAGNKVSNSVTGQYTERISFLRRSMK